MEMTRNGDLPQELVLDILLRLPVKVLSRCKCVSKNWCSLIGNQSFVKRHFESNEQRLLVRLGKKHDQEIFDFDYGLHIRGGWDFDYALWIANMPHREGYKYALYVDETFSEYKDPVHLQIPDEASHVYGPLNGVFFVVSNSPLGQWPC